MKRKVGLFVGGRRTSWNTTEIATLRLCHFTYLPPARYDNRKFYYATMTYFRWANAEVCKGLLVSIKKTTTDHDLIKKLFCPSHSDRAQNINAIKT